jgi:branched-chain amino acid transport system ATP-binding protein
VSLEVGAEEVVAIVGPNGAGKSTLTLAVCGVVPAKSGAIVWSGDSINRRRPEDIRRLGIALVPERRHIFSRLTVKENLMLGALPGTSKSDYEDALQRAFRLFPVLQKHYARHANTLSGGEQQQLSIARSLMGHPQLLILDEPSLGLSPVLVSKVFDVIAEIRAQGTAILLVEQNVRKAVELADRTLVLRAGKVELTGPRDKVLMDERFSTAYFGIPLSGDAPTS